VELTDGQLVRQIALGGAAGRTAEEALCRRYAPRVRLYGLRHLRDEDRAGDLVQAALLGIVEAARAGRIEDEAKVDRFVLGTARNIAIRMRHTTSRARPTAPEHLIALVGAAAAVEPVDREGLMRCFDKLEDRARSVVFLSFNEERSAEEIASTLAISPGNVRVVRHRAVAAIRKCLDGEGAA
jgi:RNA polymerase sigma-70 factor (ECF subfamily)